jgi:hypothetical protein
MVITSTAAAGAIWDARLDAGGAGQVDVHEHHIGCSFPDGRQRLLGGAGCAGHLYFGQGREQPGEAVTEYGMIIDDQDPGHAGTAGGHHVPGADLGCDRP